MGNAKFIEDVEYGVSSELRKIVFEEEYVIIPTIATENDQVITPEIIYDAYLENQDTPELPPIHIEELAKQQQPQLEVSLRRSIRERRLVISNDYIIYLQEHKFDMGLEDDPISFSQGKQCVNSENWIDAIKDEMKSMVDNDVWDLVELLKGVKPIICKWIFKAKRDSKGNFERYKAHLVTKGLTQKKGIDYKETFSPVSSKDSFRIIMALVAHYDLELHQIDVKTAFLNCDIEETIYMVQPVNFESK